MKMLTGPVTIPDKNKMHSKTKRRIIGITSAAMWLGILLIEMFVALPGYANICLAVVSLLSLAVFFWNLAERGMERRRHFDEREKEQGEVSH